MITEVEIRGNFRLLSPATPTSLEVNGDFKLRGPAPPTLLRIFGGFALDALEPDMFVYDSGWVATTKRVWTGTEWFPPVT